MDNKESKRQARKKASKRKGDGDPVINSKKGKILKSKDNDSLYTCTFLVDVRIAEIEKLGERYSHAIKLLKMETHGCDSLMHFDYGPTVTHVYNPVDYAFKPHVEFYRKYCQETARVLLIGENPGPFGGAQTGIPFGDPKFVKEWLQIEEEVSAPDKQHPKRPISGFSSTRSEGSGTRLWTFLKSNFKTPESFFSECFIYNYCPMIFMNESGGNVTPSTLPAAVRKPLMAVCDKELAEVISSFPNCTLVVGIGRFTESRLKIICEKMERPPDIAYLNHPSPRNPEASKNWDLNAYNSFVDYNLIVKTQ
ncbi:single-strand selective monofunctional uracil DNA glycosylase-like [Watersipora subatra]|uniref:single-strand selective monofunctional uracil DNA glycosylase-like n=1 Tax=Watersipora subatra TaxID=2589382 RepID=UPI00355B8689